MLCATLLALATILPTPPAATADSTVRIKNLKTLCVCYRSDPAGKDHMDDAAVERAKRGVELGRLFYFRNSGARLNCTIEWMVIDAAPPKTDGPTMQHLEADLAQRGVKAGQFDGVFVTGIGLAGNWGGFSLFNPAEGGRARAEPAEGGRATATAGCFGGHGDRGELTWYPSADPDEAYGTAWNFVHEYQHAIDLVIAQNSGRPDLLHAHPYTDRLEPFFQSFYQGGEHWDWIACTFRAFDGWLELRGATHSFLECTDSDDDGLADDDPRLPTDEKRFGSDSSKKDTDGDGLDDLAEFTADRYASSDPTKSDTDEDGTPDATDRYPVLAIAATVPYRLAGSPAWVPLIEKAVVRNDEGGPVGAAVEWDETTLYFRFAAARPFSVHAKIDGSAANGFWEGGDTYLIRFAAGGITFDGLGLSGPVPGANVSAYSNRRDGTWFLEATLPARIGQGVSKEINYGGKREPEDAVDGLTLVAGRSLGFNFGFEFEIATASTSRPRTLGTRALLMPLHTMYAATLVKPADAPEVVILRGPQRTADAAPAVEVLGVSPSARVRVEADGKLLGLRIGPGPVVLSGLDRDGPVTLRASAGESKSDAWTLVVDRTAEPPRLTAGGPSLQAECEPGADFELWWGSDGLPVAPLAGGRADRAGRIALKLDESMLVAWRVTGFEGSRFEKRVYVDAWQTIDRNFEGGPSDPRLPGDGFSYRLDAYLTAERAGRYTFELTSDDGARLYVNDELLINHWGHHGMSARTATVDLPAGPARLHVDYYELDGWAGIRLRWPRREASCPRRFESAMCRWRPSRLCCSAGRSMRWGTAPASARRLQCRGPPRHRSATLSLDEQRSGPSMTMNEIEVTPELVGKTVRSASRPEWGNGTVLTVTRTSVGGSAAFRVSIQFASGHRILLVPPARLTAAEMLSQEERPAGWIERIGGTTPDDRLRNIPTAATEVLGTLEQRVAALAPLYGVDPDDERGLLGWARAQSGVVDPLTRWTRDELCRAFAEFSRNRDDHLRAILGAAKLAAGGSEAVVPVALASVPVSLRERMLEVLRRPI